MPDKGAGGENVDSEILKREFIYLWYYFTVQLQQIFRYWVLGMMIGSAVSVFAKEPIIPLLQQWLFDGMSVGSAASFMLTGPATKITNLGALKIVLGAKHFFMYLAFTMVFSFATGFLVNLIL